MQFDAVRLKTEGSIRDVFWYPFQIMGFVTKDTKYFKAAS